MVLGLSGSKINYQFKKMYQRKIIHSDWAFLTNSMGKEIKTLTNEEAQSYWQSVDKNKLDLEAQKENLKSITKQIDAEMDKDEWDKDKLRKLKDDKKSVQAKVDILQAKVDEANLYDLGLIATIAEPNIEILSETSKELIFQISFKPGSTLFYTREGKKAEYDLGGNGIKYAFRVSIGKIKITSDKKIVEIDENGKEKEKTLRDKGINDNDFTIQALFLDFENANIANYDSKSSTLPEAASDNALLQAAMGNYFKSLANSDNPYVLGYGIHKNEVQEGERGLFYPTGVAYSTSHSREERASTFNFLMLLNNHRFPSGNDSGVLPISLMEYAQDTTATVNGVFGLNMSEFENNYVPLLSKLLYERFKSNLYDKHKSGGVNNKNINISYAWHNVSSGKLNVDYQGIYANANNRGVDIKYKITSEATIHHEQREAFGTTVGIDWDVSTSGNSRDTQGKEGSLIVTLKAGASGKLEFELIYQDFSLGYKTDKPRYKDTWDQIWDVVSDVIQVISGVFSVIQNQMQDAMDIGNNFSALNDIATSLHINELEELENKVILPVASVYTYKNVRILGNSSDQNAVLLFDTSYGTVAQ
jgi:hypothetical protein